MKMTKKILDEYIIAPLVVILLILSLVLLMSCPVAQAETVENRKNSLGVLQTYDNPWAYMVGSPVHVDLFESNGTYYTNVVFKALGASLLNTQTLLFCGNQLSAFGDGRLRAVTYRNSATRSYRGVGCHEVLPIDAGVIVLESE